MATGEISLRPMSLRPGGGGTGLNPFAKFGKGAAPTRPAGRAPMPDEENRVKKSPGEIVRYDREFLLLFSQQFADLPANLEPSHSECVIDKSDPDQSGAREALQNALPAAEETDDRNWRTRTQLPDEPRELNRQQPRAPQPQAAASSQAPAPADSRQNGSGPSGGGINKSASSSKLQSAAELGKKAWMPGKTSAEGDASALKQVKGILNKLTPEKFDRLLGQLIEQVKSVDVLNGLIKLVFDNAVEQPTFVVMYAQLCEALAAQLPELAPPAGESKPMSFQRLLLNTCQDQFEATIEARQAVEKLSGFERESQERDVKKRTLGCIRLIAELYKKDVVKEPVVHVCINELMTAPAGAVPSEDNIEALCEMISIAGKKLEETSKAPARFEGYVKQLDKMANNSAIPPRIRFLLRDVLDLRRMKWVPRREKIQAKKISDIHAEAHAELGMIPALASLALPPLPGLQQIAPVSRSRAEEDVDLFPAFAGAEDGDWQRFVGGGSGLNGDSKSSLLGDYTPIAQPAAAPAAASNATPPQTTAAPQYIKDLTDEERERRADGLFTEFLSSADEKEALLCAAELAAPGFLPTLVQRGVLKLLDLMKEREQETVTSLLVRLQQKGAYSCEDLQTGIGRVTESLDDLIMDAPLAPKLLGDLLGHALLEGALQPPAIAEFCKPIEMGETRRAFAGRALQYIKEKAGADKLKELTAGVKGSDIFAADPELDPPDLIDVPTFLEQEGLSAVAA